MSKPQKSTVKVRRFSKAFVWAHAVNALSFFALYITALPMYTEFFDWLYPVLRRTRGSTVSFTGICAVTFITRSVSSEKLRQFTSDMDIFAEIKEEGERTGLLGYREDLWRKNTGMDKRLVFKLFNETVNWRATMDLMIGRSLQMTLGARGLPVTCFSINVGDHANMVYLERSGNKWPLMPENFSFFLLDDGKPTFYRLRRDFVDLGGDYTLYDHHNEKIGRLDGRVFSIGGYWRGRVKAERADPRLLIVLKFFCGMLIFNGDCRRHMRRLAREVIAGRYEPKIEKQEADLYMNPRRVR